MALISDQWDAANPDNNNASPPNGAPEGATRVRDLNDCVRLLMSSGAEQGDLLNAQGSMAVQNSNAVTITDPTQSKVAADLTGSTNVPAAELTGVVPEASLVGNYPQASVGNSDQFGGLTVDVLLGVGEVKFWYGPRAAVDANPYWAIADGQNNTPNLQDLYLRGASDDSQVDGSTQGDGSSTLDGTGGQHVHTVDGHALTESEMPSHSHGEGGTSSTDAFGGRTTPEPDAAGKLRPGGYQGGNVGYWETEAAGGGQAHSHGLTGDGRHSHTVLLDNNISHARLWVVIRVA